MVICAMPAAYGAHAMNHAWLWVIDSRVPFNMDSTVLHPDLTSSGKGGAAGKAATGSGCVGGWPVMRQ